MEEKGNRFTDTEFQQDWQWGKNETVNNQIYIRCINSIL